MSSIIDLLRAAWNAVDPVIPLPSGAPQYVDCKDVRGGDAAEEMRGMITWSNRNVSLLVTGHRGCGKSTELLRLKSKLEEDGYCVLYFGADKDLDMNDTIYSDLLLAVARRIVTDLCADRDITLDRDLLRKVEEWFATTLYEQAEWERVKAELDTEARLGIGLPAGMPLLARVLARVTGQIQTGHTVKKDIRLKLDPQLSLLVANINLLIGKATEQLRRKGHKGLVLLVDNLDRITYRVMDGGRTSHEALYIDHGPQLCSLDCHVVYTVPISMLYTPTATQLMAIFPEKVVVPMIKVKEPDEKECNPGLDRLRTMLRRRIPAIDTLFSPGAVERLIRASGGHPRDLMRLARYACTYAHREEGITPIDEKVAERAVGVLTEDFGRMIPEEHYPKLARVHIRKQVENDVGHQMMLYNLSVLEYRNGKTPWHDVHPAVEELPKFREAWKREQGQGKPRAHKKAD